MENLLQQLNKEQLSAVTHKHGSLLIVAGAGTGKTTVITQRIAYMIEKKLVKPDEILALTFTEKAAGEMEERVDRILPIGYFDLWISTFHGFGERILKEHGIDIGLSNDCKLLNEFEQYSLIIKNLDKFDLDYYRPMGNPTKFIKTLIKHFSRVKDEDISPTEYLKYAEGLKENLDNMLSTGGMQKKQKTKCKQMQNAKCKMQNSIEKQEVARINEVANAYHIYQQLLLDNNSFDFGDLINYCLKLFRERPAILEKYRQKFQFILVDEFQDTNWAQYELIKMLAAPKNNLVVVADDDQAIFRFRGASMSNVLQFQKDYPKSKKIILINNYRSKQNILDLSYKFIQLNNPNRLECQFKNQAAVLKLNKKLIAQNKGDGVIEVIQGTDLQDEVRHVVGKIAELKETKFPKTAPPIFGNLVSTNSQPVTWNDFAILVRANESAKDFCATLEATGLPYQFLSSRGLYAKPIIMDIIAYLKLLDNYHESSAVYRVLNLPIFNFSYQELVNFNYWARKKTWSLYEVLRSAVSLNLGQKINEKINKFISFIEKHSALTREKNVSEIIFAFLNDSGYLKYLLNTEDTKRIEKNTDNTERASLENMSMLNQFMKKVKTFESANDDKTVKAFLLELQMEIDAGEQGALPVDPESGPEAIKIMTVHSAKGLEFKYVFVANMVDKRFPTIERRDPILIPDPLIKEILQIGDIHLEEERRLFYVAMTRAKDHLYFSWSPYYGGTRKKKPSRFLTELDIRCPKTAPPQFAAANWGGAVFGHRMSMQTPSSQINIPSYFSYTQLVAFSNCPYQYYFAHILKIPIQGKAQFSFGKTMHSTLQKLFQLINEKKELCQDSLFNKTEIIPKNPAKISMDEIFNLYEQSWVDNWYNSKDEKIKYKKKGKEILKEFYEKHKDNWPNTIFLEKKFNFKIKSNNNLYTICGTIDRVDEIHPVRYNELSNGVNGKIKIIDYKTGAPKEKLSFEEKQQLLLYQLACRELFEQEIDSLVFYYLNNNTEVEFLGSDEDLNKTKENIIQIIQQIQKVEFLPKPSPLCKYCDFNGICESRAM